MPSTKDTYGRDGSHGGRREFVVGVFLVIGALSDVGPFYEIGWFYFVICSFAVCGFFAAGQSSAC